MPEVYNRAPIVSLPPQEATTLYLENAVVANNPLQNKMNLWEWTFGKNKVRMLHLGVKRNNLQPRTNCDGWNPTVSAGVRGETIEVTDFEVNGEQCPDEFDQGYMRELREALGNPSQYFKGTPQQQAILTAIVATLSRNLSADLYSVAYFGDTDIRTKVAAARYGEDPHPTDPKQREQMFKMLEQMNGIWTEIYGRVESTNQAGSIVYVDTNNGTTAGNATRPENVTDYFRLMKAKAKPQLRQWRDQTNVQFQKPVYLVQEGIYEGYKEYLRTQQNETGHQFILDGEPVEDVLRFDGHLVILVPEWEMHDAEMGRVSLTGQNQGYSNNQRALFTVLRNFSGVANMSPVEGQPNAGLVVQQSDQVKDKGKTFMYASYGIGVGIAQPDLVVAGYSSNPVFI